jgi:hypothetical protein
MRGPPDRIQYAPRQGATYSPNLDVLIPAMMKLRKCEDSLSTLILIEQELPDLLLPDLAYAASQKRFIPHVAVKTVVKYCGPLFLERRLGKDRARELMSRYADTRALSGL